MIPKKCLTLGLCLEYETFIRGVFCPNLFVCLCVCLCVCVSAFLKTTENENEKFKKEAITLPTFIRNELFERRIEKNEMEDNVPIGMKRKASTKTAEEKRTADVNALQ